MSLQDTLDHCSDGGDEGRDRSKKKKEPRYAQLERASSEEELVDSKSSKSKKGGKVFGKLHGSGKGKEKRRTSSPPSPKRKDKERSQGRGKGRVQDLANRNSPAAHPVFGVRLEDAVRNDRSHDGVPLPKILRLCIDFVQEHGLESEGIYRVSPPKTRVDELVDCANAGLSISFPEAHCAAALLKLFLRQLPDHLLTPDLNSQFEKAAAECPCSTSFCTCLSGDRIKALLKRLPLSNYFLLAYFFLHMQDVIKFEKQNKMGLPNVGLVLQATLCMSQRLLTIFLRNTHVRQKQATSLFEEIDIKKYVSPLRPPPDRLAVELPSSPKEVEEELAKQQSLLTQLHEEVAALSAAGASDPCKEQQLWEVQMVVTQLNRRMKAIRQLEAQEKGATAAGGEEEQGPCLEMFEEKQLLAVQMELKERIAAEKRTIADLQTRLALCPSPSAEIHNESWTEDEWEVKYKELEQKRDYLLSEMIEERRRCARLRAQIEFLAVQKQTVRSPQPQVTRL